MRWATIALLLANLAYFSWSFSQPGAQEFGAVVNRAPSGDDYPEVPSLTLLEAESGGSNGGSYKATRFPVPFPPPAVRLSGAQCWLIGPLPEKVTAKQVRSRFQAQGMAADILSSPRRGDRGYALYLQGSLGVGQAREQVRLLQLAGYADARLTRESGEVGVQVGHYPVREQAEKTRAALSAEGFTTLSREQFSEITQLVLRVILEPGQEVSGEFWRGLERDFPRYPREQNWCGAIASVG